MSAAERALIAAGVLAFLLLVGNLVLALVR